MKTPKICNIKKFSETFKSRQRNRKQLEGIDRNTESIKMHTVTMELKLEAPRNIQNQTQISQYQPSVLEEILRLQNCQGLFSISNLIRSRKYQAK